MDDDEQVEYRAAGTPVDPDDVLFSGSRAMPGDYDEYDPLLKWSFSYRTCRGGSGGNDSRSGLCCAC